MSKERLECACRTHLPELSGIWDEVFKVGHSHYLDLSTEETSKVAYSPDGVAADDHKRRRKLTLGRYLARLHDVTINADIERGINKILADLMGESTDDGEEFAILRGKEITEAYVNRVGSHSCMVGEGNRHITEWFALFPEKIGLLVWKRTEGRALLWTCDDGRLVLDRIYAGNLDLARSRYTAWCKENGAVSCFYVFDGVDRLVVGSVSLGETAVDGRPVPYFDSFCYATSRGRFQLHESDDTCYVCQDCDGELNRGRECNCCGDNRPDSDEAITLSCGDWICGSCANDHYFYCDGCDEYRYNEGCANVGRQWLCESCIEDSCESCAKCGDTCLSENVTECDDEMLCSGCLENHASSCDLCSNLHLTENLIDVQGASWCNDCHADDAADCVECGGTYPSDDLTEDCHCCDCQPQPELTTNV